MIGGEERVARHSVRQSRTASRRRQISISRPFVRQNSGTPSSA